MAALDKVGPASLASLGDAIRRWRGGFLEDCFVRNF